ncbi:MAG: ATP-grasp domain-containing protein, partial [Pseudomonadota bacterium]
MNIHEYQAKDLLKAFGAPVGKGVVTSSADEAIELAKELDSDVLVVKAQIHAGGRGKAGGVKVVKGADAAKAAAEELMGKVLVTHQTGPEGKKVQRLYVEQGLAI